MRFITRASKSILYIAITLIAPLPAAKCQSRPPTADGLVDFLTFQNGARPGPFAVSNCGQSNHEVQEDRAAAEALVALGSAAIPSLEHTLNQIENEPRFVGNQGAPWILYSYSTLRGASALPRLVQLFGKPQIELLQRQLDGAIAISLHLTSYVDSFRLPNWLPIVCGPSDEPKDALDRLILAWLRSDKTLLGYSLGTKATLALDSFQGGQSWGQFRALTWEGSTGYGAALGYRFNLEGAWSEPIEILGSESSRAVRRGLAMKRANSVDTPEIETHFTDRSGQPCGDLMVEFSSVPTSAGGHFYQVNGSNVEALLRMLAGCGKRTR